MRQVGAAPETLSDKPRWRVSGAGSCHPERLKMAVASGKTPLHNLSAKQTETKRLRRTRSKKTMNNRKERQQRNTRTYKGLQDQTDRAAKEKEGWGRIMRRKRMGRKRRMRRR